MFVEADVGGGGGTEKRARSTLPFLDLTHTHTGVHTDIVRKEKNKLRQSAIKEQSAAETASYCTTVSFALPLRPFVLCVYGGGGSGGAAGVSSVHYPTISQHNSQTTR